LCPRGAVNKPFKSRINKLAEQGLKPIITKIPTSTEEFAFLLEMGLIKVFGRKDLGTGTLHNLSNGGEGSSGRVKTTEEKLKVSASLKKFYAVNDHVMKPETIAKIKLTKRSKPTGTGKWMHKDGVQTKVKSEDVQLKLESGWSLGIIGNHITQEYKDKMSKATATYWAKKNKEQSCL
jgi:hypothetical protein